jgi:hypothetical protein
MILVHSSPRTLEPYRSKHLGVLCSPRRVYNAEMESWRWAADNDAYSAWDAERYKRMLDQLWGRRGCLFITAPDVVGDANRTRELYEDWADELSAVLQPIAYVVQDGLNPRDIPWAAIDALFIGGTTEFKMGELAAETARLARKWGKWVHMGRVNGHRRVRYAKALGVDSIDGTSLSWFRDTYLPEFLHHAAAPTQLMMGGGR